MGLICQNYLIPLDKIFHHGITIPAYQPYKGMVKTFYNRFLPSEHHKNIEPNCYRCPYNDNQDVQSLRHFVSHELIDSLKHIKIIDHLDESNCGQGVEDHQNYLQVIRL